MRKHSSVAGQKRNREQGQSIVEFVLVLPVLLVFFIGMIEVGFAMYSYLRLAGANREGARMASRGRFTDDTIMHQVVASGGSYSPASGGVEPNLRTTGPDPNTGMIITHYALDAATGAVLEITHEISGTITVASAGGSVTRSIQSSDSRYEYSAGRGGVAQSIYEYRDSEDFFVLDQESFVVVETFYSHDMITNFLAFLDSPLTLYFSSELRVLSDSRLD